MSYDETPIGYASRALRNHRNRRVEFGQRAKELEVAINLDGQGYFTPYSPERSQARVVHHKKVNPKDASFAHYFNKSIDFYDEYTKRSEDSIIHTTDKLSHSLGRSVAQPLKIGPFSIDPLLDRENESRITKPIHILKGQKLTKLFTIGGT